MRFLPEGPEVLEQTFNTLFHTSLSGLKGTGLLEGDGILQR